MFSLTSTMVGLSQKSQMFRCSVLNHIEKTRSLVLLALCLLSSGLNGVHSFDYCQRLLHGVCLTECGGVLTPLGLRSYLCGGKSHCCIGTSRIVDRSRTVAPTTQATTQATVPVFNRAGSLTTKCGQPVHSRVKRVVGGTFAERCQFPWMVYIKRGPREQDFCSGALVSDRHVITAAHCMDSLRGYTATVTLGEYNRLEMNSNSKYITSSFSVHLHPRYNRYSYDNDLAILTLTSKVPLQDYECLNTLCLPEPNQTFSIGTTCTVAGWGSMSRGLTPQPSHELVHAKVQVVADEYCTNSFRHFFNNKTQICAGDMITAADSCDGDSGGPLMCESSSETSGVSNTLYLAGVISTGANPCGQVGVPAIYADLNAAREWVDRIMAGGYN